MVQGTNYGASVGAAHSNTSSLQQSLMIGITTDPTKSGMIVNLSSAKSTTAQLYFKVANAVENLELLDAGEVLETLADKTDMAQAANASMPSSKHTQLTLGTTGSTYIAPESGWFKLTATQSGTNGWFTLNNITSKIQDWRQSSNTNQYTMIGFIPCAKNDVIAINYDLITPNEFYFIYSEGAKND